MSASRILSMYTASLDGQDQGGDTQRHDGINVVDGLDPDVGNDFVNGTNLALTSALQQQTDRTQKGSLLRKPHLGGWYPSFLAVQLDLLCL